MISVVYMSAETVIEEFKAIVMKSIKSFRYICSYIYVVIESYGQHTNLFPILKTVYKVNFGSLSNRIKILRI